MIIVKVSGAGCCLPGPGPRPSRDTCFLCLQQVGGSLVDCPTQLTLVTWICQLFVFHDKYQWEIWKNTAGKSARGSREAQIWTEMHKDVKKDTMGGNSFHPTYNLRQYNPLSIIVGRFPRGTGTLIDDSVLSRTETSLNIFRVLLLVRMMVMVVVVVRLMVMIESRDKSCSTPGEHDPDGDR